MDLLTLLRPASMQTVCRQCPVLLFALSAVAFQQYNSLSSTRRRIPYTFVRGASDWTYSPVVNQGGGLWLVGPVIEDFEESYK